MLITKWVGDARESLSSKTEMVIRAFRKCSISVAIDGSEDKDINIRGVEDYTVEMSDSDSSSDGEASNEDPFADSS